MNIKILLKSNDPKNYRIFSSKWSNGYLKLQSKMLIELKVCNEINEIKKKEGRMRRIKFREGQI